MSSLNLGFFPASFVSLLLTQNSIEDEVIEESVFSSSPDSDFRFLFWPEEGGSVSMLFFGILYGIERPDFPVLHDMPGFRLCFSFGSSLSGRDSSFECFFRSTESLSLSSVVSGVVGGGDFLFSSSLTDGNCKFVEVTILNGASESSFDGIAIA